MIETKSLLHQKKPKNRKILLIFTFHVRLTGKTGPGGNHGKKAQNNRTGVYPSLLWTVSREEKPAPGEFREKDIHRGYTDVPVEVRV